MSEKTSIIKSSTFSNEWENPSGGITYYFDIELANGEIGSTGVTQKNSPKIAVGNEVTYTKNGNKIKITKSEQPNAGGSQYSSQTTKHTSYKKTSSQDAFLGYAWSYAKDLIIAGKTMDDVEELNAVARYIYDEIGKMLINEY
jgi:hypothetical protein